MNRETLKRVIIGTGLFLGTAFAVSTKVGGESRVGALEQADCQQVSAVIAPNFLGRVQAVRLYADGKVFEGGIFSGVAKPDFSGRVVFEVTQPLRSGGHELLAYADINQRFYRLQGAITLSC